MLKILKASAGSGKTYNLAREYIRLILTADKADAYRHVLAVTFTNKATDEMKRRILKELYILSRNPGKSPYLDYFVPRLLPSAALLQKRARQQLSAILHDYSAFAVSTIDRFFQQTLRAFSREIGQFSSYQVQLDRKSLVSESVDRVLDRLTDQDRELMDWLTRSARDELDRKGFFSLEESLNEVGGSLQHLPRDYAFPREKLERLREVCQKVRDDYLEQVSASAKRCLDVLEAEGISPRDSSYGFLNYLYDYLEPKEPLEKPKDSFLKYAPDPERWFPKSKASLKQRLQGVLEGPLEAFLSCFDTPYKVYNTALRIRQQLYSLGVADRLRVALSEIQKENNVLSIDDSNTILHDIINGTDAPFIYEKMGVRFEDFLLDEFQDTADIQWENFRPLLLNSESEGNDSLVVGDVKQSIYRFRGSDWNLLGSRLEKEFPNVEPKPLQGNYRTCREIVEFNNRFFLFAARQLGVETLYSDVKQDVCFSDPAPGSVEVCFTEDQLDEILTTLRGVRERGGEWADVAVLVRDNPEGSAIAAFLVGQGIPVVSDDSLFVKASVTVRRLVSLLSLSDTSSVEDKVAAAEYLARSLQLSLPDHYNSLVSLAEGLLLNLREADPETFRSEIPYIQSFMDYLQDWVSTGGDHLDAFLRHWEEAKPKIASPQTGNSVQIMTIHKSKGLEFPFVIVPYAEKVVLYKAPTLWCRPRVEGTALAKEADGLFRVSLDKGSADTLFSDDYDRERYLSAVDNINVFYVALTRAKYGLKVIAAPLPKSRGELTNLSQLLYDFVGGPAFSCGEPYPLGRLEREESKEATLVANYDSYPAESGERLRVSPEAADYFGPDGSFGPEASHRIRGNVLHGILARMDTSAQLEEAVDAAVGTGELPAASRQATWDFLSGRLESVREKGWFSPDARILREASVMGPDGREYRPDRVVIRPDGSVVIIDYKFGVRQESYRRQVHRYADLYRKMGYGKVEAYLWYLDDNFTIFVS